MTMTGNRERANGAVSDGRAGLYERLRRRSVLVRGLRWLLPLGAVLIPGVFWGQALFGELAPGLSAAGVRIEADRVVVEGPTFEGVLAGGGRYVLRADSAAGKISDVSKIALAGIGATLEMADGGVVDVAAGAGILNFDKQELVMTEAFTLTGPNGMRGEMGGGILDVPAQKFTSSGGVRFTLPDGGVLVADKMAYQANSGWWRFDKVRLVFNPEGQASDIGLRGAAQ
jgi:lipopolysaccharide export system protein LptC